MNYEIVDDVFTGEMPDGELTHDEDEFFDAWAEEYFDEYVDPWEDWL